MRRTMWPHRRPSVRRLHEAPTVRRRLDGELLCVYWTVYTNCVLSADEKSFSFFLLQSELLLNVLTQFVLLNLRRENTFF